MGGEDGGGEEDRLMTPGEVALLFDVVPRTVTRWAAARRLPSFRTPGGHRRYRRSDVLPLLLPDTVRQAAPTGDDKSDA